jgi:hypothetical protein
MRNVVRDDQEDTMKELRIARQLGGLAVGAALALAVIPSVAAQEAPADDATLGTVIEERVSAQTADLDVTIQERVDELLANAAEFNPAVIAEPSEPESGNTVTTGDTGTETTPAAPAESASPAESSGTMTSGSGSTAPTY